MLFNSLQFLVFFTAVTLLYYRMQSTAARRWLLLLASCYFYMSFVPAYILILGFTIVIDYIAGIQIARHRGKARRAWLVSSIVANLGILAYYKYFNFLLGSFAGIWPPGSQPHYLDIILPIGLSFHTFQAMSYTIEVYRGNQQPERNFIVYALYVLFYPQLVAGPIERPQNMLPQFREHKAYNYEQVKEGLARMLWGFFKKVVVADRLAILVDHTYAHYTDASGTALILAAVFYSFQIYCDFSGYSDIGIGAAKVMGFRLMENFNRPYLATTIAGFWSRWHISLSTWFRDYVYIPLGGNRKGEARRRVNSFIVFTLSGLWHGANWTFMVWGMLHGVYMMLFAGKDKNKPGPGKMGRISFALFNFVIITCLWVFFRSPDMPTALQYLSGMFAMKSGQLAIGMNMAEILFSFLVMAIVLLREWRWPLYNMQSNKSFALYFILIAVTCYFFGVFNENQFIYFQF